MNPVMFAKQWTGNFTFDGKDRDLTSITASKIVLCAEDVGEGVR